MNFTDMNGFNFKENNNYIPYESFVDFDEYVETYEDHTTEETLEETIEETTTETATTQSAENIRQNNITNNQNLIGIT